jgi:ferritin-like metal-binding protein YciE
MIINSKKRTKVKTKRKIHKLQKIMKTQNPKPRRMLKSKIKRITKLPKRPHKISLTFARRQSSSKTVIG